MSLSPSLPPGAPSLTEVLIERTFAKPPSPFVDGEFLKALEHAGDERTRSMAPTTPGGSGAGPQPDAREEPAPQVDVRA
jgi:hypothetical protein